MFFAFFAAVAHVLRVVGEVDLVCSFSSERGDSGIVFWRDFLSRVRCS
jgi:hypothetical protein